MFKNMKLGTKITLGFGIILLIAVLLGLGSIFNMTKAGKMANMLDKEYVPEVVMATELRGASNRIMYAMRGYGLTGEKSFFDEAEKELVNLDKALKAGDDLEKISPNLKKLAEQMKIAREERDEYYTLMYETKDINKTLEDDVEKMNNSAKEYMKNATDFLISQNNQFDKEIASGAGKDALHGRQDKINLINDVTGIGNAIRIENFKSQALRDPKIMENGINQFEKLYKTINKIKLVTTQKNNLDQLENIENAAKNYKFSMDNYLKNWLKRENIGKEREIVGKKLIEACAITVEAGLAGTEKIAEETNISLKTSSIVMSIGLIIAIILGIIISLTIVTSITGAINRIIKGLTEGAEQVASASEQLSYASQQLAESSSEQASSIEETSSTLDETSSMVQQNTENTKKAVQLSTESEESASKGNKEMKLMSQAMQEIKKSSDEISKVIKVIDDIAFQTNILALNAAVEAARAGEAGMGFAVVAEEVRNLAQRSAQAAKDTAEMIESSIKRSENGVQIAKAVEGSLSEINEKAGKVNIIMNEIIVASQEQNQGINQINKAVAQMEQVTQSIASNAEESASASEQLSAQSENMVEIVEDLVKIIRGKNAEIKKTKKENKKNYSYDRGIKKIAEVKTEKKYLKSKIVNPDEVIPLEEDVLDF